MAECRTSAYSAVCCMCARVVFVTSSCYTQHKHALPTILACDDPITGFDHIPALLEEGRTSRGETALHLAVRREKIPEEDAYRRPVAPAPDPDVVEWICEKSAVYHNAQCQWSVACVCVCVCVCVVVSQSIREIHPFMLLVKITLRHAWRLCYCYANTHLPCWRSRIRYVE
jgi:hypothetical protein